GNLYAEQARWQEAAADYGRAFAEAFPADAWAGKRYALLLLSRQDRAGYAAFQRRVLQRARTALSRDAVYSYVQILALAPVDEETRRELARIAAPLEKVPDPPIWHPSVLTR